MIFPTSYVTVRLGQVQKNQKEEGTGQEGDGTEDVPRVADELHHVVHAAGRLW